MKHYAHSGILQFEFTRCNTHIQTYATKSKPKLKQRKNTHNYSSDAVAAALNIHEPSQPLSHASSTSTLITASTIQRKQPLPQEATIKRASSHKKLTSHISSPLPHKLPTQTKIRASSAMGSPIKQVISTETLSSSSPVKQKKPSVSQSRGISQKSQSTSKPATTSQRSSSPSPIPIPSTLVSHPASLIPHPTVTSHASAPSDISNAPSLIPRPRTFVPDTVF